MASWPAATMTDYFGPALVVVVVMVETDSIFDPVGAGIDAFRRGVKMSIETAKGAK